MGRTPSSPCSKEDRAYLRREVTNREDNGAPHRRDRVRCRDATTSPSPTADRDERLRTRDLGRRWKRHVRELRTTIVGQTHRRKGLGALMARELYLLAAQRQDAGDHRQDDAASGSGPEHFRRLGFRERPHSTIRSDQSRQEAGSDPDAMQPGIPLAEMENYSIR